jgi:hypothetical protein
MGTPPGPIHAPSKRAITGPCSSHHSRPYRTMAERHDLCGRSVDRCKNEAGKGKSEHPRIRMIHIGSVDGFKQGSWDTLHQGLAIWIDLNSQLFRASAAHRTGGTVKRANSTPCAGRSRTKSVASCALIPKRILSSMKNSCARSARGLIRIQRHWISSKPFRSGWRSQDCAWFTPAEMGKPRKFFAPISMRVTGLPSWDFARRPLPVIASLAPAFGRPAWMKRVHHKGTLMVRSRALARRLEPWATRPSFETHRLRRCSSG